MSKDGDTHLTCVLPIETLDSPVTRETDTATIALLPSVCKSASNHRCDSRVDIQSQERSQRKLILKSKKIDDLWSLLRRREVQVRCLAFSFVGYGDWLWLVWIVYPVLYIARPYSCMMMYCMIRYWRQLIRVYPPQSYVNLKRNEVQLSLLVSDTLCMSSLHGEWQVNGRIEKCSMLIRNHR